MRYNIRKGPSIGSERGILGHVRSSETLRTVLRPESARSLPGSPKVRMDFNRGLVDIVFPPVAFDGYAHRRSNSEEGKREQLRREGTVWPTDRNGFWVANQNENEQNAVDEKLSSKRLSNSSHEVEFQGNARFYFAFSALVALAMMVGLHGTAASSALPIITRDLEGTTIEAFWSGTSFFLSSAVFQLPVTALSNTFGRMSVLTFCVAIFLIGIIISGVASDFTAMLFGRVIQGIGAGGINLMNDIVLTDLVPLRLRGRYVGIIAGTWALATVSGPVIGGVLAEKVTWRWIFWLMIPLAGITLVMVPLTIRLQPVTGSIREKLVQVDWIGNLLIIFSITIFLVPLSWGGVQFSWSSWATLVPIFFGAAGLVAFGFYESRVAAEPTLRLDLVANYNIAYSLFAAMINTFILFGVLYFIPLYYEAVKQCDPIISAAATLPATFPIVPTTLLSGILITKTGHFRFVTMLGWLMTTIGMGTMYLFDVQTGPAKLVFLSLFPGIGLGVLYTSLTFVNQSAAKNDGITPTFVVGLFIFARSIGKCLGVAICGVIFQNQISARLLAIPSLAGKAAEYSRTASSLVLAIHDMPDGLEKMQLIQAYADSLKIVWAVLCALSGIALLGSFWIRPNTLDRVLTTEQPLKES